MDSATAEKNVMLFFFFFFVHCVCECQGQLTSSTLTAALSASDGAVPFGIQAIVASRE